MQKNEEPATSGDSGDESGSEPESPSEKIMQNHKQDWPCNEDRDVKRDLNANDNLPSTSTSNPEQESSKSSQPSLPKILPKIDLPGGAMLYHSSVLTGLDGLGSNLGLGNLAMGYPHSFILGLANQGQEGASSSTNQPQFITIPLSMAMAAASGPANGCASSDDSSELQDLSTGGRK
ncbi:unnamed protein product, partial [Brenthis ino]